MNPTALPWLDHPVVFLAGLTLLHFLWQGTLLAVLAVAVRRKLQASPAATRRWAAILFLGAAALCPVLTFLSAPALPASVSASPGTAQLSPPAALPVSLPVADSPLPIVGSTPPVASDRPALTESESSASTVLPPSAAGNAPEPSTHAEAPILSGSLTAVLPWLVLAWAGGVVLLMLRQAGGWWLMRQWQRDSQPVPDEWKRRAEALAERMGLARAVRLVATISGRGPALAGLLRPVILIPSAAFTGMNPVHLEAILLHELAHLKQRDHWVTALLIGTETLLFYHPAVWLLSGWVRAEREHAADERAAAVCGDRMEYARALAGLAGFDAVPGHGLAANGGSVADRIRRLTGLRQADHRVPGSGLLPALAAAAGALCLTFPIGAQTEPAAPATAGATDAAAAVSPASTPSLQALVDAAAEGAVIRLAEGVFETSLVLTKSITLEGAGEAVTSLRQKSAESGPVITLRGARQVTLRGLRLVTLPVTSDGNGLSPAGVVEAEDAEFTMEHCSIAGPYHCGLVLKSSSATLRHCLISGMWSNGITVGADCHDVSISHTDVRNCFYTPIVIGRRTERITVDHCRISGGAWHGIRYDDSSPEITHNLIFGNARSGIYASGKTKALIRGNVFLANEMGGISCWFANEDTIEGNTFSGNLRESIAVLGGSKPVIRNNILTDSPLGFSLGKISGKEGAAQADPAPVIGKNLLWNIEKGRTVPEGTDPLADPVEPVRADPQFLDPAAGDFRLSENSPAKQQGLGALDPLPSASPWALTAGEKSIIPDGASRSSELWKTTGFEKRQAEESTRKREGAVQEQATAWTNEALQIDSVERRDAAIAAILKAVSGDDIPQAMAGLMALSGSVAAEFDKAPFRAPVRRWIGSDDPALRNAALRALTQIGAGEEDLDALYTLAENKETPDRGSLVSYLQWIGKGDLTGRGGQITLDLLSDDDPARQRNVLNAIWGARFSEALETRVIELSRREDWSKAHDAIYYALSPQANKSIRSIDRLLEVMVIPGDRNNTQRAFWGLGQGVGREEAPYLAQKAVGTFEDNLSPEVRNWCLSLVKSYGSAAELPFLDRTAARPAVTSTIRKAVEEAKAAIAARNGEPGSTRQTP